MILARKIDKSYKLLPETRAIGKWIMTAKTSFLASLKNLTGHRLVMSSINKVASPGGETENYWKVLRNQGNPQISS